MLTFIDHHRSKGFINTIVRLDLVATKCLWAKNDQIFFLSHHFKSLLRSRTITSSLWQLTHFTLGLEERVFKLYHVILLNAALLKILISKQNWKTRAENWEARAAPAQRDLRIFLLRACVRGQCTHQAKVQTEGSVLNNVIWRIIWTSDNISKYWYFETSSSKIKKKNRQSEHKCTM